MTRTELNSLIDEAVKETLELNREAIDEHIRETFNADKENSHMLIGGAIAKSTSLSLTLVPSLSGAITARLLVKLGLVSLEDDE